MSHNRTRLDRKRRRSNKTNYNKRLKLLKSEQTRLVVRKTNTQIIAQLVQYEPDGDKVIVSVHSNDLRKLGWEGSCKNIPAAYLTGKLIAKKAKDNKIEKAILDVGLHTLVKGSRVFAVAKGAIDGGLDVPMNEEAAPSEERIKGEHMENDVSKQFEKVESKVQS